MGQILKKPYASAAGASDDHALTYEEFLNWDGENQHVEWVDGKVIEMAPISDDHQDVGGFLHAILRIYAETHNLGKVRTEPFQMKTGPDLPGRAPDILFVATKNLARLKRTYLAGPADVVVEIISPGSQGVDRGEKFYEYEQGGVREYWLLDPIREQAEFYRIGKRKLYRQVSVGDVGTFRSEALKGFWI